MTIINCKKCGKPFAYDVWGAAYPGGKDRENADCPYCGETGYSEVTSQCISVYKVNENGKVLYK